MQLQFQYNRRTSKIMDQIFSSSFYITLILLIFCKGVSASIFALVNKCSYTVWPGILGNAKLETTGFELTPGMSRSFQVPPAWSGRFWGRTGCAFNPTTGQGTCKTADCGSNQIECNGLGAAPPATIAEFTTGSGSGSGTQDFYDVSLVDGYNIPMFVEPSSGTGNCLLTGCAADMNQLCPPELREESGEGCKSACEAFGNPEYCCSGAYNTPATCQPSVYSKMFKGACPSAYSYAYDDATSTFTCTGADYTITFCPPDTSQKSEDSPPTTNGIGSSNVPPLGNGSWLPNYVTGDLCRTLSSSVLLSIMAAYAISFIFLS